MSKTKEKQPFFTATRMAAIAIFAATGGILYSVQIPMPVMFAPWLKFNPSDIPILIGSFALGAPSGAIIAVLRTLIGLLFKPTTTAFIGETADILCGVAFAVPAGLFYAKKKTKGGAGNRLSVGRALLCGGGGFCESVYADSVVCETDGHGRAGRSDAAAFSRLHRRNVLRFLSVAFRCAV